MMPKGPAVTLLLALVMGPIPASRPDAAGRQDRIDSRQLIEQLREFRAGARLGDAIPRRGKCGLALTFQILQNWNRLTDEEKTLVRTLLSAQVTQNDRIIGHFHVYYDTAGPGSPALLDAGGQRITGTAEAYVDSVGRILNHVWSFEIDGLGYSPPPLGPDGAYRVTIRALSPGLYGQTIPDPTPITAGPPPRYSTTIEVDNDFREVQYFSRGISALEVTCAHEFHHAIQLGAYGFWGDEERYFHEITSTWMEDVVYGNVHDYYQYLSNNVYQTSQFSTPDLRFTKSDQSIEYSRAVWGKFIEKRFSRPTMRRIWEWMRQYRSLDAMDRALAESGSSLRAAYLEYAYWNITAGPAADTSRYYSDGRDYPAMRIASTVDYLPPQGTIRNGVQAMSSAYHKICILSTPADSCGKDNSMFVIVSNVNAGAGYSDQLFPFLYTLSAAASQGTKQLNNGLYAALSVPDPEFWSTQETAPTVIRDILVFPDPFQAREGGLLWFRFPASPLDATAKLSIFSSGMLKIFSADLPVINFRPQEPALSWNGRSDRGEVVSTGIYFFVIAVDEREYMGKFSAIRN